MFAVDCLLSQLCGKLSCDATTVKANTEWIVDNLGPDAPPHKRTKEQYGSKAGNNCHLHCAIVLSMVAIQQQEQRCMRLTIINKA